MEKHLLDTRWVNNAHILCLSYFRLAFRSALSGSLVLFMLLVLARDQGNAPWSLSLELSVLLLN